MVGGLAPWRPLVPLPLCKLVALVAEASDSTWEYADGKHIAGFWALTKKAASVFCSVSYCVLQCVEKKQKSIKEWNLLQNNVP
eukprot:Skav206356  [mRNA]  locus=scaffold3448:220928:221176:- [translate_table: standard]